MCITVINLVIEYIGDSESTAESSEKCRSAFQWYSQEGGQEQIVDLINILGTCSDLMLGRDGYNSTIITSQAQECANTLRNRTNEPTFQQHVTYIEAIESENHVSVTTMIILIYNDLPFNYYFTEHHTQSLAY